MLARKLCSFLCIVSLLVLSIRGGKKEEEEDKDEVTKDKKMTICLKL